MTLNYNIEFVNSLALTPIDLTEVDTSNLFADASTINVARIQTGSNDTSVTEAVNDIHLDVNSLSGSFTFQHNDIDSGTPVTIGLNNADYSLTSVVTGVTPVDGVQQQYRVDIAGTPTSGYLHLAFQTNFLLHINFDESDIIFNGTHKSSIQAVFDDLINPGPEGYGPNGGGPWTVAGSVAEGALVFIGGRAPVGQQTWTINGNNWDVSVEDSWINGVSEIIGVRAQHQLIFRRVLGGTWTIGDSGPLAWNAEPFTVLIAWSNHVATLNQIQGAGTEGSPFLAIYDVEQPQALPTINASDLSGINSAYLQDTIGTGSFVVSDGNDTNVYTITSVVTGSGQDAIVIADVDTVAGVSLANPIVRTHGIIAKDESIGVVTWDFSPNIGQSQNFVINTNLGDIGIYGYAPDGNDSDDQNNYQVVLNQFNSSNTATCTVSGSVLTVTLKGDFLSAVISSSACTGTHQPVVVDIGGPSRSAVACVHTWVSPVYQGALSGIFSVNSVNNIAYDIIAGYIGNDWATATGKSIAYIGGTGTNELPWEFHFNDTEGDVALPTVNGSGLRKGGVPYNNFSDGDQSGGQSDIQTVSLADTPTGGSWSITLDSSTIDPLDHNIAANDLQAALRTAWSDEQLTISGTSPYQITFGDHAEKSLITADGSSLTKDVAATITRIQIGQNI